MTKKGTSASSSTVPPDGWVEEYYDARSEAKEDKESASKQLRVARAATKLRMWEKVSKATRRGLEQNPTEKERKQLEICQAIAEKEEERTKRSYVNDPEYKNKFRSDLASGEMNIDTTVSYFADSPCYTNLNMLQVAALRGDVAFLEEMVAFGAAIDFPVGEDSARGIPPCRAPIGATSLVLICANLANSFGTGMYPPVLIEMHRKVLDGQLECAIRLVKLGADFNRKFEARNMLSTGNRVIDVLHQKYQEFGMVGKTARELAVYSKKKRLIKAIDEMSDDEKAIQLVNCRCGSRLPWVQCHAGRRDGESLHYQMSRDDDGRRNYRYSPLAPCPCKLTGKTHYSCCWNSSTPRYQDDTTGELFRSQTVPMHNNPGDVAIMEAFKRMRMAESDGTELLFPARDEHGNSLGRPMTNQEVAKLQARSIRTMGQAGLRSMAAAKGPKCNIGEWDADVVAGCVERIGDPFIWVNVHWPLDKSEILLRVKEWNEALEKYCDDVGLTGDERAAVVKKHTASPCAPCANPSCDKVEESVKQFKRCGRCKHVSYCSGECQRGDWHLHKKSCINTSVKK
jgi:hypothetical protein